MISLDEAKARIEDFLIKTFPSRPMNYNYELNKFGWIITHYSRKNSNKFKNENLIFIEKETLNFFEISKNYKTDYVEEDSKNPLLDYLFCWSGNCFFCCWNNLFCWQSSFSFFCFRSFFNFRLNRFRSRCNDRFFFCEKER